MQFWKIVSGILGVLFIVVGSFLVLFISMLDDREVEGPSGAVNPSDFIVPVLIALVGIVILFLRRQTKNLNQEVS